jgi:hypothetical protein
MHHSISQGNRQRNRNDTRHPAPQVHRVQRRHTCRKPTNATIDNHTQVLLQRRGHHRRRKAASVSRNRREVPTTLHALTCPWRRGSGPNTSRPPYTMAPTCDSMRTWSCRIWPCGANLQRRTTHGSDFAPHNRSAPILFTVLTNPRKSEIKSLLKKGSAELPKG